MSEIKSFLVSIPLKIICKSIGQIMLQESVWTGLFFLIGIAIGSVNMALAALLATITAFITARMLSEDESIVAKGLLGFSPALVGVAMFVFLKPVLITWILVVAGAVLATWLQYVCFKRIKIPVFTLPFVLVVWLAYYLIPALYPHLLLTHSGLYIANEQPLFFIATGYGQIIFQASVWSGILFFIGVGIKSPIHAIYGVIGGIISALVLMNFNEPTALNEGLLSYNGILCAIVFAGKQVKDFGYAILSVLLSCVVYWFMFKFNMLILTFPFVVGAMLVVYIKKNIETKR